MADDRKLVIEIVANGESSSAGVGGSGVSMDETEKASGAQYIYGPQRSLMEHPAVILGLYVGKQALQDIYQVALNETSWYFKLSEDYKSENSYRNTLNVIGKFGSAAGSIGGGAAFGASVGGPIGAAVGAAIGTAQFAFSTILGAINAQRTQTMQIASRSYGIEFNKELAGIVMANNRGTEY